MLYKILLSIAVLFIKYFELSKLYIKNIVLVYFSLTSMQKSLFYFFVAPTSRALLGIHGPIWGRLQWPGRAGFMVGTGSWWWREAGRVKGSNGEKRGPGRQCKGAEEIIPSREVGQLTPHTAHDFTSCQWQPEYEEWMTQNDMDYAASWRHWEAESLSVHSQPPDSTSPLHTLEGNHQYILSTTPFPPQQAGSLPRTKAPALSWSRKSPHWFHLSPLHNWPGQDRRNQLQCDHSHFSQGSAWWLLIPLVSEIPCTTLTPKGSILPLWSFHGPLLFQQGEVAQAEWIFSGLAWIHPNPSQMPTIWCVASHLGEKMYLWSAGIRGTKRFAKGSRFLFQLEHLIFEHLQWKENFVENWLGESSKNKKQTKPSVLLKSHCWTIFGFLWVSEPVWLTFLNPDNGFKFLRLRNFLHGREGKSILLKCRFPQTYL